MHFTNDKLEREHKNLFSTLKAVSRAATECKLGMLSVVEQK